MSVKNLLCVAFASSFFALSIQAKTCYWIGVGETGAWTDAGNWKDGDIPGRLGSLDDAGSDVVGDFGDTAVFDAVASGAHTTIDLSGLRSIGHIIIRGSQAPTFTFGNASGGIGAATPQNLRLEPNASFTVESDVVNAPVFYQGVRIIDGFDVGEVSGLSAITNTFQNESSAILDLPAFGEIKNVAGSPYITEPVIELRGQGDIRLNGEFYNNFEILLLNQTGTLIVNTVLRSRESGLYAPYAVEAGAETAVSRIWINAGCELTPRLQYQNYVAVENADMEILGEGLFGTHFGGNNTRVRVAKGRTLTVGCPYKSYVAGAVPGFCPIEGEGTVRFLNSANEIQGVFQIATACTVEANSIGNPGEASSLGTGSVGLGGWGTVKYIGTGETTGKHMSLTNCISYVNSHGTLCQAGTGLWRLTDVRHESAKTAILQLDGTADAADAEITAALADYSEESVLSVSKLGKGRWILSGVNTYTGKTTLLEGTLRYAASQTISLLALQGRATLEVADGVTITVKGFERSQGTHLDIIADPETTKVVIPDLVGKDLSFMTWNGASANVGADGTVTIEADATIAARGDAVPNNGGIVAIVRSGEGGNDTLASDIVTVGRLEQVGKTPATVEIGEDRKLVASEIRIDAVGGDLSIGATGDTGTLDASGGLLLRNNSRTADIVVNADFGANISHTVVRGPGRTVLSGKKTIAREMLVQDDAASATGTLALIDAQVTLGEEPLFVGYHNSGNDWIVDFGKVGKLIVTNSLLVNATVEGSFLTSSNRCLGIGRNAIGTMIVESGSVISNKLQVGVVTDNYTGPGRGALYMRGGDVTVLSQYGNPHIASGVGMGSGHGYIEMTGGALTALGDFSVGYYGTGVWYQRGDVTSRFERAIGTTADPTLYIQGGNGFSGLVYLSDGAQMIHSRGPLFVGSSRNSLAHTHIVIEGEGSLLDNGGEFAYFNDNSVDYAGRAYVDVLRGGTFRAYGFTQRKTLPSCWLSFDGGVFKCAGGGATIFCGEKFDYAIDRVTVYDGGMTIDTDGKDASTGLPISGATGKGVVGFNAAFPICVGSNVSPYVEIEGDGEGAAAVALYDSDGQCVTNLLVTAPGVGYTAATAKVYLAKDCVAEIQCVLAENANTGSFTKAGEGTLTLTAANTWGGDTVLAGGILRLGVAGALPSKTTVVFAGGLIDADGQPLPTAYAVDCATFAAQGTVFYPEAFSFPEGSTLTVRNVDALDSAKSGMTLLRFVGGYSGSPTLYAEDLPERWSLRLSGNRLRIGPEKGLTVIIR